MKLIAKTQKGLEFMHSINDSFFAPNSDSETWFVYDYDFSQNDYCFKKLSLYRGNLKARDI